MSTPPILPHAETRRTLRGPALCLLATVTALALGGCLPAATTPSVGRDDATGQRSDADARAHYRTGLRHATGDGVPQDYAEALRWFERAAALGYPPAEYMTGIAYSTGRGVAQDQRAAVRWFTQAARAGHARAQYQLGDAYLNGRGVAPERAWGVRWIASAAARAHQPARFALGVAYATGLGVPADDIQAVRWLTLAQSTGHPEAAAVLGKLGGRMPAQAFADGQVRAGRTATVSGPPTASDEASVRFVQAALADLGFRSGGVDGLAGPRTASAVRAYRNARKLAPGDALDETLLGAIRRDLTA